MDPVISHNNLLSALEIAPGLRYRFAADRPPEVRLDARLGAHLPYLEVLQNIRTTLAEHANHTGQFPRGGCGYTAGVVRENLGLQVASGKTIFSKEGHSWNYDPDYDLWIDLTLDQFEGVQGEMVIVPSDSPIYIMDPSRSLECSSKDCHEIGRLFLYRALGGGYFDEQMREGFLDSVPKVLRGYLSGKIYSHSKPDV